MEIITLHKFTTECTIVLYESMPSIELHKLELDITNIIDTFEQEFSRFIDASTVSCLNRWKKVALSLLFLDIVKETQDIIYKTNGAFHSCVSVENLGYWKSFTNTFKPTPIQEKKIMPSTSFSDYLLFDEKTGHRYLVPWIAFDFWWIGKWYLVDKIWEYLKELKHTDFLINFWWDILVNGDKWNDTPYHIEIDDGLWNDIGMVDIYAWSLSTSGTYKRNRTIDGKEYHHIVTPETGINSGELFSVTVIGANTTTTDSFATAVMTWNVRSWLQLLQENSLDWILIDSQKNIHMTDGFSKKYNLW